ncbi:MAG: peptidylprolyl isomerase [Candidatus Aminicenantes bacterium]|nr:peptidylprolyl isomerase [Candidatus Aminicenantes bacterium]
MRKALMILLVLCLFTISCSSKKEGVALKEGTPAYLLAKDLSAIIGELDPELNKVILTGKDFTITSGEVIHYIYSNLGSQADQLKQSDAQNLKQYIERNAQLITDRKLLIREADAAGITIPPEQVEIAFNQRAESSGGPESFTKILTDSGISVDSVKNHIKMELVIQKYLDEVIGKLITVNAEEVEDLYNQPKTATVRHILLLTQNKTAEEKDAVLEQMQRILIRARQGEDFAELAKEFSEDPGSKDIGGLYEDFGHGVMVKPFEEAAFSVPIGEISDIVETQYGYHILKVIDRKKETRPLEEVSSELEEQIKQFKLARDFQEYMGKLRQEAEITIIPLSL